MFETPRLLEAEELAHFHAQGWLRLSGCVNREKLEQLGSAVDALCRNPENQNEWAIVQGLHGKEYVIGINSIVPKSAPVFTEVLASDWLRGIAQRICGDDFFLVQDFVVVKNIGDNSPVNWHQDVVSPHPGKAIMIGIYLDASDDDNGALRIIPQSHLSKVSICELEKMPYQSLCMQPGDVLVHDLMLAHSSGVLTTQPQRRVVYFEFMSAQYAVEQGIYPPLFVEQRSRVVPASMKAAQGDAAAINELQQVYEKKLKVKAASYCFEAFTDVMR
ncbi:MAG: phytanoyl-CoA dioxygenase family protein [Bacteroidetes bacterium]|nr:phytanoyl-CoA dioxygenase family protein [Bacteroidota bacterium]